MALMMARQINDLIWRGCLCAALLLASLALHAQPASNSADGGSRGVYQLAVGDRIKVHVLGHEDLSVEVQVSDSGEIIYPLLGELEVVGLTREEIEELIYYRLKPDYLRGSSPQ